MSGLQMSVFVEYQIVSGKGGFFGTIDLMGPGKSHALPLDDDHAKRIAEALAPDQAAKAKKEAEDEAVDDGRPIFVFKGTFDHDPTANSSIP